MSAVGLAYAREELGELEASIEAIVGLLDTGLDSSRLMRAASRACKLAVMFEGHSELETDTRTELCERMLDCGERLVSLSFDRGEDPLPLRGALSSPEFERLRTRSGVGEGA